MPSASSQRLGLKENQLIQGLPLLHEKRPRRVNADMRSRKSWLIGTRCPLHPQRVLGVAPRLHREGATGPPGRGKATRVVRASIGLVAAGTGNPHAAASNVLPGFDSHFFR